MPQDVDWIKDKAAGFNPEKNSVSTKSSGDITYDYLVVALGHGTKYDQRPARSFGVRSGL